ncbi:MAG: serine O-acetyltransferase [Clostridia bacterium]|nr:serine O-acetyltransferase [Clostridia bacterium]
MGLLSDARSIAERDPAARNVLEVILLYPGFRALFDHKIASFFLRHKMPFIARWISQCSSRRTGIEIHPGAKIGNGLFIDHGHGIVIGETAEIGDFCTIYHQVTLGGTGVKRHEKRHPTIGNNVLIGAGAKILGPITVGDNSMIGSGSIVLSDVPANSTVAGLKARVIKTDGERVAPSMSLEHAKIIDPIAQDIASLREQIKALSEKVAELEKEKPGSNNQ